MPEDGQAPSGAFEDAKTVEAAAGLDRPAAIELLTSLASENVDGAAYHLGKLYWLKDLDRAKYWLRLAAAREDEYSHFAALYLPDDIDEAKRWLSLAFDKHVKGAALGLGIVSESESPQRALELCELSAQQGSTGGYHRAAWILLQRGDQDGARRLYLAGAKAGDPRSMVGLFNLDRRRRPLSAARWLLRSLRAGGWKQYRDGQVEGS